MTTLGAPTLFPIPPDGAFPITLSRAWLTDVQRTRSGKEVRLALRERAARRLEYKATLAESVEIAQFLALWLAAAELLRFYVPIWPEDTDTTAFPDDHTIVCDTTDREFIAGEKAIIWWNETTYEVVTIDSVAADHLTTVDAVEGDWSTYLPAPLLVAPVMEAWLSPPTREQRTPMVEHVSLVFDEELPGVAGVDPTVGGPVAPTLPSLGLEVYDTQGTGLAGRRYFTVRAFVVDVDGQRVRAPGFTWSVVATGTLPLTDPSVKVCYPNNEQEFHIEYDGGADDHFDVTCASGVLTETVSVGG